MVLPEEVSKDTIKDLGMKHIYWLDNQTINYVLMRYRNEPDLEQRMAYADYIRARMNFPKPLDIRDINALSERFPFRDGVKNKIIPAIKNTPIIDGIIERKDMIKNRILNDDRSAGQVGMDEIDDYFEDIATRYEAGQYQEVLDLWREFSKTHKPEQVISLYQRLIHDRDIVLNVVDLKEKIKRKGKSR